MEMFISIISLAVLNRFNGGR